MLAATQQLLTAVRENDNVKTANALGVFVQGNLTADDPSDGTTAAESILASLEAFPRDSFLAALVLAALNRIRQFHHVDATLTIAKQFHNDGMVIECASRLMCNHAASAEGLQKLPSVANAAADWIATFPHNGNISYWGSAILVIGGGLEPEDVKKVHGQTGLDKLELAVIRGAMATKQVELYVEGFPWNDWVLHKLYPRLRSEM